jgi:hypothetical protein
MMTQSIKGAQAHYREVLKDPSLRLEGEELDHLFERAGLGFAPFKLVGVHYTTFISSCDFCGTAIQQICTIKDSRGHTFKVGNVCVEKTGDRGLIDPVKDEVKRLRKEARAKKDQERVEAAKAKLDVVRDALRSQPHPFAYHAEKGGTLLSYVEWLFENGGTTGRLRAAKIVESVSAPAA